jgi:hypothetical protein
MREQQRPTERPATMNHRADTYIAMKGDPEKLKTMYEGISKLDDFGPEHGDYEEIAGAIDWVIANMIGKAEEKDPDAEFGARWVPDRTHTGEWDGNVEEILKPEEY